MIKVKSLKSRYKNDTTIKNGFGLVDAIVGLTLLSGVIIYGIYFSSLRLSTVYKSNLTSAINKEIQRDIEKLKYDFWELFFENEDENGNACIGQYCIYGEPLPSSLCSDFTSEIVKLDSWDIDGNESTLQSWKPGSERSKVFTGENVTISREVIVTSPLEEDYLNKTIASIHYSVQMPSENIHWLSISMSPEALSWCRHLI